jgi:hypothetical protein
VQRVQERHGTGMQRMPDRTGEVHLSRREMHLPVGDAVTAPPYCKPTCRAWGTAISRPGQPNESLTHRNLTGGPFMGSIHVHTPNGGPALPDLPPIPIGALAVGLCDLLDQAKDLAQPRYITISDTQSIGLQFGNDQASLKAIDRWARRFGSEVTTSVRNDDNGPWQWVTTTLDWFGVEVVAYAHIPLTNSGT